MFSQKKAAALLGATAVFFVITDWENICDGSQASA